MTGVSTKNHASVTNQPIDPVAGMQQAADSGTPPQGVNNERGTTTASNLSAADQPAVSTPNRKAQPGGGTMKTTAKDDAETPIIPNIMSPPTRALNINEKPSNESNFPQ